MPQNTIDFPDPLYDRVRAAATADRRAIKHEVLTLVEEALDYRQARASFAANSGPGDAHRVTILDAAPSGGTP